MKGLVLVVPADYDLRADLMNEGVHNALTMCVPLPLIRETTVCTVSSSLTQQTGPATSASEPPRLFRYSMNCSELDWLEFMHPLRVVARRVPTQPTLGLADLVALGIPQKSFLRLFVRPADGLKQS